MVKKNNDRLKVWDWIYILCNVTSSLSIIGVFLFDWIPLPGFISFFFFNLFFYAFRWPFDFHFLPLVRNNLLLSIFFLIYIVDFVQNIFLGPEWAVARLFTFFSLILFIEYLYNLCNRNFIEQSFYIIVKPYNAYCIYNVAVVIIVGLLIFIGVFNPESNEMSANSLVAANVNAGQQVFFPGHLSVAVSSSRLLSALSGFPVTLTGLSHEPHVLNFLILPSFFFLCSYNICRKKYWIVLLCFLVSLTFSFSTTAFLVFSIVLLIDIVWTVIIKRRYGYFFIIVPVIIILLLITMSLGIFSFIQDELTRKTVEQTSSVDYSSDMLKYIISPHSFLGYGNLPHSSESIKSYDVGIITSILDVVFYVVFLLYIIKMTISKDIIKHYTGLGCLYMIIHLLKVNLLAFNYPYLAFIVFVTYFFNHKTLKISDVSY